MEERSLGIILDTMAFKSMSKKELIDKVVDEALGSRDMTSIHYRSPVSRIKAQVDRYADKYGNLGVSRRKLVQLATKELRRRERRTAPERWKMARHGN